MDNDLLLHIVYAGTLFLFGLMIGSFLNVVIYRAPLGKSLLEPPSTCPSCGTRIQARDNVPVLGWLLLGGKCRTCKAPISYRYPLVELTTGVLWAWEGWRLAGIQHGYYANIATGVLELAFISAMVVTFLVDWDHMIILDEISIGGTVAALAAAPFLPNLHHATSRALFAEHHALLDTLLGENAPWLRSLAAAGVGTAVGLAVSLAIYFAGTWLFRRQIEAARERDPEVDSALGLGDVKLMACFGAFLGWKAVVFSYAAASLAGAAVGTVLRIKTGDPDGKGGWTGLRNRWRTGDAVVPFGPFLVIGALLFLFLGDAILERFAQFFII